MLLLDYLTIYLSFFFGRNLLEYTRKKNYLFSLCIDGSQLIFLKYFLIDFFFSQQAKKLRASMDNLDFH